MALPSPVVNLYTLSKYDFYKKEPKIEKDTSVADRLARLSFKFLYERRHEDQRCRHLTGAFTCSFNLLSIQEHNHPHLLLLQIGNTFHKLPGGRLKPGENEIEGLKRKLTSKIGFNFPDRVPDWQIGECVARWWRPNFERYVYPYCPNITEPKECRMIYMVHLSGTEYFAVPQNLKLLAVPFFELYDNAQRYGTIISKIPHQLSRFQFNMINNNNN
ncbi:Pre-mRNA cleavage factor Im subunit 2 [Stylosanthes scabra]|uniref:Pre-mRNA cleavage factor Im 25 kDa subunit n=1 Tax=Stylosanthes scabra TaxID=79078 RepID=A0ABU6YN33_9FABA|nr:Pre-mRNA cleavage factor Im subunit 2 [Stylosanthes scabra]